MAFETISNVASQVSNFTSSSGFQSVTNGLEALAGYNTLIQGQDLRSAGVKVTLNAVAASEQDALTSFQVNTLAEQINLAEGLQAIRLNTDSIISEQRTQLAARGLGSSRTALEFLNDTISRAERTVVDLRQQSENRRRVDELGLRSTLGQIHANRQAAELQKRELRRQRRQTRSDSVGGLLSAGGSIIKGLSDLFG